MNNTSGSIVELQTTYEKRSVAKVALSGYLSVNQDDLPQDLIAAWQKFERAEKEVQIKEAGEMVRLEHEIEKAHKKKANEALFMLCLIAVMLCCVVIDGLKTSSMMSPLDHWNCPNLSLFRC